jgi:hypothetical protein
MIRELEKRFGPSVPGADIDAAIARLPLEPKNEVDRWVSWWGYSLAFLLLGAGLTNGIGLSTGMGGLNFDRFAMVAIAVGLLGLVVTVFRLRRFEAKHSQWESQVCSLLRTPKAR